MKIIGRVTKTFSHKNGTIFCFVPDNPERKIIITKSLQKMDIQIYKEFPFCRWREFENGGWDIYDGNHCSRER